MGGSHNNEPKMLCNKINEKLAVSIRKELMKKKLEKGNIIESSTGKE